ncbi:MAG: molybdenum cofactor biosynthesis protein MoaE [Marinobacter sp.]|uniref:molybdenum cofactor biosynthesis protein MoaE n=1 Tax=Marinobacter sp. TaxID=50741 RepID=UPI00299EB147|nr:molybdenum cofactor biosynthesis protein MoaE [Marinobacter sp.]MDX1755192.1 molybdenum cofactor biosynthesis protein MoaE [Marinobacter sp.]
MVIIQTADFDHAEQYQALRATGPATGAIATFTGLVRDFGDCSQVRGLFLEHYPGMTERVIEDLIQQAAQRWDVQAARVIHRVGELALGDQIVFVGICSAHRGDAFAACQFVMDALKTSAPFWKKELAADGDHWVEQKDSDLAQARQWRDDS